MHIYNILCRGLTIVVLATLLLLAASLPCTAVPRIHPVAAPNAGWQEVEGGSASGEGISDNSGDLVSPSVAIAPDGMPYVVWHDWSGGVYPEIYARRWIGQSGAGEAVYLPLVMEEGDCACGPDNYEPNDSFDQAHGPLISGQTYQSYISCCDKESQRDYFYINISTTSTINIDLTNIPVGVDYALDLYNSDQVVVAQSQEDGNSPEQISFEPPSAGKYYILVSSPYSHTSTSPYSLQVAYDGCDGPDNYEPNNWCSQSHGLLTSGQTYQSWISDYDLTTYKKSDYFCICSSGNNYINIHLTNIPVGTDYDLFLYKEPADDPDNPVAESRGTGTSETISYPPPHLPLIYYIRVYSYSGYSTSPYSLKVTYDPCPAGPILYLPIIYKNYFYHNCDTDNYEPNDSCNQAYGPLTSGQTYQSSISYCDVATYKKSDYFYIDISITNTINIYLTDIPAGTDYDLYLYKYPCDGPGNPVAKSTNYGSSPETISYNPPANGRYYIRVYSYSGYSASPYSLRVTYD